MDNTEKETLEKERLEKVRQKYRERFIRWQQLSISQLSYSNNLIMSLTLGMLAFSATKLDFKIPKEECFCLLISWSYFLLLASLLTGIILTINRLNDFRKTKELINSKKKRFETKNKIKESCDLETIDSAIESLDNLTNELGKSTWVLFHIQLWTFFLGSLSSIIMIIIKNN